MHILGREGTYVNVSPLVISSRESFMNKTEALAFCFLAFPPTELTRICPSFFSLQLSKKDLFCSGGNKKLKVFLRILKQYIIISAESNILHFISDILMHSLLYVVPYVVHHL